MRCICPQLYSAAGSGGNFEQAYTTAYRLQDIDRLTSRDWDDNLDLRKALQMLINQMNEEAALVS
jgi:hypothetical protein